MGGSGENTTERSMERNNRWEKLRRGWENEKPRREDNKKKRKMARQGSRNKRKKETIKNEWK